MAQAIAEEERREAEQVEAERDGSERGGEGADIGSAPSGRTER
ncbi:hypothetical protein [Salinifilum ghardaiensis]